MESCYNASICVCALDKYAIKFACMYVHTLVSSSVPIHIHIRIRKYEFMCAFVTMSAYFNYVRICNYMCICRCVCVCVYMHSSTYISI